MMMKKKKKNKMMTTDEIAEVLRLLNGGPEGIAKESALAHKLMTRLKDSLIAFSAQPGSPGFVRSDSETEKKEVPTAKAVEVQVEGKKAAPKAAPKVVIAKIEIKRDPYEVVFDHKPLGMSWNQTSDGKNLYVQDVVPAGLATTLGVQVGSLIHSFNKTIVHNTGPDAIYQEFKSCSLPISIGFLPPAASGSQDEKVLILKQVTGLETKTVIKLLHKFNGNVQAANEAFYIAKARTKQYLSKQQEKKKEAQSNAAKKRESVSPKKSDNPKADKPSKGDKKKVGWWSNWKNKAQKS